MTPNEERALADLVFEFTKPHTQEEIAEYLGLSRSAVVRIEERALGKLRGLTRASWQGTTQEPTNLHRRCGDVFYGDGAAPKREVES